MSSEQPKPPSQDTLTLIKKKTEELGNLFRWVAELIRSRNWFTLLLLVDVVLILFFTPDGFLVTVFKSWFSLTLTQWYSPLFWLAVVVFFLAALIVAVWTMPRTTAAEDGKFKERTAIKGLRPFRFEDRKTFSRLQRQKSIQECLETISNPQFRIGILLGESGCGKTSFLQAGLLPQLAKAESRDFGIYMRFSERDPIATIREAFINALPLQEAEVSTPEFLSLLELAAEAISPKFLVLFFDQFEQFFIHYKRKEDREFFIKALQNWYFSELPIKIFISIRGDFSDRLVELQKALCYSLGPQEVYRLENFSPDEAKKILKAIAESENITFDERFIAELAERELSSQEDGLISPIDLQILAWIVAGQKTEELQAFNRLSFQKLGGVEGLLRRFLYHTLEARIIPFQRQATVKVLLAMTDLNRQVRAGAFTIAELQEKLKPSLSPSDVEEATCWLVRGDVRLLTSFQEGNTTRYEIAHERLIPALIKLAGKELSEVEQANQLLERRVNEWLGNQRSSRFLLSWQETLLIQRQKPYLTWGTKQSQKEKLLAQSQQRLYQFLGSFTVVLLFSVIVWGLWISPWGQIHLVRWELSRLSRITKGEATERVAIAFAKDGRWEQALNVVENGIQLSEETGSTSYFQPTETLASIAEIAIHLGELDQALGIAKNLDNSSTKSRILESISEAAGQIKETGKAQEILQQILDITETIDSPDRARALASIAKTYGQLGYMEQAQRMLQQALEITKNIRYDILYEALAYIEAAEQLGETKQAQRMLQQALEIAKNIRYDYEALASISEAAEQLGETKQAQRMLQQALEIAENYGDYYDQARALASISEVAGQIYDLNRAQEVLEQALNIAKDINEYPREWVLSPIAKVAGQMSDVNRAQEVLEQVFEIARNMESSWPKSEVLGAIAEAAGQIKEKGKAKEILQQILEITEMIDSPDRAIALASIAKTYGKLGHMDQARELIEQALGLVKDNDDISHIPEILDSIAQATVKLDESKQVEQLLKEALDIVKDIEYQSGRMISREVAEIGWEIGLISDQSEALVAISEAVRQLDDVERSQVILRRALKIVEDIGVPSDQLWALHHIAKTYTSLGRVRKARNAVNLCIIDTCRQVSLAAILTTYNEQKNPSLVEETVN
ncbi:MAG: hypothetical protein QNJ55_15750 [Xenococcus sp. MO_188.B8]|nr:hypothetical protein [Xenococcus sp. MO_188.B8]